MEDALRKKTIEHASRAVENLRQFLDTTTDTTNEALKLMRQQQEDTLSMWELILAALRAGTVKESEEVSEA